MRQLVVINNNQIVVSSKDIVEYFGKQLKHVLETIREILVAEIRPLNFSKKHLLFIVDNNFHSI